MRPGRIPATRPVVGLGIIVALLLTACGADNADEGSPGDAATPTPDADEDAPVTLVFESYNYGTEGVGGEGTQQLIDEFEADHPNITIEPKGTPAGEIHTSVHTQAAAGDPPDVAQIGWSKFGFLQENLPYVPYEEFAPADELDAHLEGMYPAAVDLGRVGDELAGLAYTVSTPTMFINADLFAEAGLDPGQAPTTWAEAQEAALEITAETGAQGIYVDAANAAKSDFLTQTLINSNGGRLFGDDGSLQLDDPAAVEALAMLGELSSSGAQPTVTEAEAIAMFESGQLGMLVTSTALLAGLVSATEGVFELETSGLPAYDGHEVAPTVSGAGLFVFTEDPAKQAAAWEFIKFLTGDRGFTIISSVIGYLPLRPGLIDDPQYLGEFFAEDDRLLPTIAQLDSLMPYQVMPGENGQQALELMQDNAVAAIMISGADPEPTIDSVAENLRGLLNQ